MQSLLSAARLSTATALVSPISLVSEALSSDPDVAMPGDPSVPASQQSTETRSLLADLGHLGHPEADAVFDRTHGLIIGQVFDPHPILEGLLDPIVPPVTGDGVGTTLPGTPLGRGVTTMLADPIGHPLPEDRLKLLGNPALNEPISLPPRTPSDAAANAREAAVTGPAFQRSDPKQDIVRPADDIRFGVTARERQTLRNVLGDDPANAGAKLGRDRRLGREDIVSGAGDRQIEGDRARPALFVQGPGDVDEVSVNDIKQQNLEDCYFMAAVGAIAMTDPQRIRNMVVDNGNGTYTVTFKQRVPSFYGPPQYVDHSVTVTADFPGGLYSNGHAAPGDESPQKTRELWPLVLEKAYGQYLNEIGPQGPYTNPDDPYQPLQRQGNPGAAFEALTGRPATLEPNSTTSMLMQQPLEFDKLLAEFQSGRPMVLCSYENDTLISKDHCFVITNVYRDANGRECVQLYNPWGTNHPGPLTLDQLRGRPIYLA